MSYVVLRFLTRGTPPLRAGQGGDGDLSKIFFPIFGSQLLKFLKCMISYMFSSKIKTSEIIIHIKNLNKYKYSEKSMYDINNILYLCIGFDNYL